MIYPSVFEYQNTSDFFRDFLTLNREKTQNFSLNYFSMKLKWPRTYLDDLAKKRKPLSINKVSDFSNYFKLSALEREKLVSLYLKDKCDKSNVHLIEAFQINIPKVKDTDLKTIRSKQISNIATLLIYKYVENKKLKGLFAEKTSLEAFITILQPFGISPEETKRSFEYLNYKALL